MNLGIDCSAVGNLLFFSSTPKSQSAQKVLFTQGAFVSKNPKSKINYCNSNTLTEGRAFNRLDADYWRDPVTGRIEPVEPTWNRAIARVQKNREVSSGPTPVIITKTERAMIAIVLSAADDVAHPLLLPRNLSERS
jgi:hypothetical protein